MKITVFTKYLNESLKIFIEYCMRPFCKGEIHIRKLEEEKNINLFLFGGINMPPKCPNIDKLDILGANLQPQIKINFNFLLLLIS